MVTRLIRILLLPLALVAAAPAAAHAQGATGCASRHS